MIVQGVLFDFDGTLARTMENNFEAWRAAMRDFSIEIQPEEYFPTEGMKVEQVAALFFARNPAIHPDLKSAISKKESYYLEHHQFSFYPRVHETLSALLAARIKLGIVTSGQSVRLEQTVPAGFLAKFDCVITGDMKLRGKPNPDPYLRGLELLGLTANRCVVVENAPLGIQSAKRANLYCIAVGSTVEPALLTEADEVVETFADLSTTKAFREILSCEDTQ